MGPKELRRRARGIEDGEQIRDMLIYLGRQRTGKSHRNYPEPFTKEKRHYYTCKNFKDGQCAIYADRPAMCRSFPNGQQCVYAACEWDAVNGPETLPQADYDLNGVHAGHPALLARSRMAMGKP